MLQTVVIRAKLDLAWAVKDYPIIFTDSLLFQTVLKPVEVGFQVFHAEEHGSIGTQVMLHHNLLHSDKIEERDSAWIWSRIIRRVKVYNGTPSIQSSKQLGTSTQRHTSGCSSTFCAKASALGTSRTRTLTCHFQGTQ